MLRSEVPPQLRLALPTPPTGITMSRESLAAHFMSVSVCPAMEPVASNISAISADLDTVSTELTTFTGILGTPARPMNLVVQVVSASIRRSLRQPRRTGRSASASTRRASLSCRFRPSRSRARARLFSGSPILPTSFSSLAENPARMSRAFDAILFASPWNTVADFIDPTRGNRARVSEKKISQLRYSTGAVDSNPLNKKPKIRRDRHLHGDKKERPRVGCSRARVDRSGQREAE
jgi:hypothetical protein